MASSTVSPRPPPISPASPLATHHAIHLEWARTDLHRALLLPPSPLLPLRDPSSPTTPTTPRSTRSRAPTYVPPYEPLDGHVFVEPVPNLELHSAAAEGNVGLVHYALTHGQPINSVLHGVQPIHAAAAGGSVSALRMLLDRGADVNAPRLPRRYSNEKKRDAPSLGAAGATPLHFAAANGHADIVQLLLTNGATPDKADKLGQTAESLAQTNGHGDVLDVLRVYDALRRQDSYAASTYDDAASTHSGMGTGTGSVAGPSRPASPDNGSGAPERSPQGSRKGKERAFSFASIGSNRSEASGVSRVKRTLGFGALLGRRSRKNSLVPTPSVGQEEEPQGRSSLDESVYLSPEPSLYQVQQDGNDHADTLHPPAPFGDGDTPQLTASPASSYRSLPDAPSELFPFPPSRQSSSSQLDLPHDDTEGDRIPGPAPLARHPSNSSTGSHSHALARVTSGASAQSHSSTPSAPQPRLFLAPPREHRASHSSRRPSLPSIFEKAVHPGQAFRAALRHRHGHGHVAHEHAVEHDEEDGDDGHSHHTAVTADDAKQRSVSGNSFFGRGRSRAHSDAHHDKSRRYKSKASLIGLFRRSHSPPSRSPSPPRRMGGALVQHVDPDELNDEIDRLRRTSVEQREHFALRRASYDEGDDKSFTSRVPVREQPKSAPATKTRFFEDLGSVVDVSNANLINPAASEMATPTITGPPHLRGLGRPRKGSEVIAPSPLANEWARESSDSDSTAPSHVRRTRTEGSRDWSGQSREYGPSKLSESTTPPVRGTKPRSATLPSSPGWRAPGRTASGSKLSGVDWEEGTGLRSGVLIRESERKREVSGEFEDDGSTVQPEVEELADEEGNEVFHDAVVDMDAPLADVTPLPEVQSVIVPDGGDSSGIFEIGSPPKSARRFRGASVGSVNSAMSRLSTGPGSSVRFSSGASEDGASDRQARYRAGDARMSATAGTGPLMIDGRPRGKSVSSIATTASGSLYAFSQPLSTPSTSLTPPSALSITLSGGSGVFPPVPEHSVAQHPPLQAQLIRKYSSRAEVEEIVRQAADDVRQLALAQGPDDESSARDLAAQLAAFGDSYALHQEMARRERRERKEMRREGSSGSAVQSQSASQEALAGSNDRQREGDARSISGRSGYSALSGPQSDRDRERDQSRSRSGSVSASASRSGQSLTGTGTPSMVSVGASGQSLRSGSFVSAQSRTAPPSVISGFFSDVGDGSAVGSASQTRPDPAQSLFSVDAPQSSVPNINSIYDRRAAQYREKMQALTAAHLPPARPAARGASARQHSHASTRRARPGVVEVDNTPRGPPAWLTGDTSGRGAVASYGSAGRALSPLAGGVVGAASSRPGQTDVISSSLPIGSLPFALNLQPPGSPSKRHGQGHGHAHKSPRKSRLRTHAPILTADGAMPPASFSAPSSRVDPPTPIAEVVHTRGATLDVPEVVPERPEARRTRSGGSGSGTGSGAEGAGPAQGQATQDGRLPPPAKIGSYTVSGAGGKSRLSPSLPPGKGYAASVASSSMSWQQRSALAARGGAGGASTSASASGAASSAPAISIFSHRFAGPHDGGDSDDSEHEARGGYAVVENDWKGGTSRVVRMGGDVDALAGVGAGQGSGSGLGLGEGKKRWGLKGLISKK